MHFLLLGYDGTDSEAPMRRTGAREKHLEGSTDHYAAGRWLDSGALLDDEGAMVGSFVVCDYPSREAMQRDWLDREPYVLAGVWQRMEIHPIALSPRALSRKAP